MASSKKAQLLEAHKKGVEEGKKHSSPSPETIRLISEQKEYFAKLLDAHEKKEIQSGKQRKQAIALSKAKK